MWAGCSGVAALWLRVIMGVSSDMCNVSVCGLLSWWLPCSFNMASSTGGTRSFFALQQRHLNGFLMKSTNHSKPRNGTKTPVSKSHWNSFKGFGGTRFTPGFGASFESEVVDAVVAAVVVEDWFSILGIFLHILLHCGRCKHFSLWQDLHSLLLLGPLHCLQLQSLHSLSLVKLHGLASNWWSG